MRILLDTHMLLWSLIDSPKLTAKSKNIILDPANSLYYSSASIWEASIKYHRPNSDFPISGDALNSYCRQAGLIPLHIQPNHAVATQSLISLEGMTPGKDPFDRMLLAQAKSERMYLLTHDKGFSYYNESCIIFD